MSKEIEGIKPTVPGYELLKMVEERAEYHRNRVIAYANKIESFKNENMELDMGKFTNNPVSQLESSLKDHKNKVALLEFLAEWMDVSATYILSVSDLSLIGKLESGF
jgi:hypothetical protein